MTHQEIEYGFQEVWKMIAETSNQIKETERYLKELFIQTDRKIDALTGKWGRFVEGLVLPAAKRLFAERGIAVEKISPRVMAQRNGEQIEIDILVVGEEEVVMIEVKSTLSVRDVKDHLKDLGRFKGFFPEYATRKLFGAVAGIVIDEGVDRYAYQQGLFVIGQSGETVKILNDDKFQPKEW